MVEVSVYAKPRRTAYQWELLRASCEIVLKVAIRKLSKAASTLTILI